MTDEEKSSSQHTQDLSSPECCTHVPEQLQGVSYLWSCSGELEINDPMLNLTSFELRRGCRSPPADQSENPPPVEVFSVLCTATRNGHNHQDCGCYFSDSVKSSSVHILCHWHELSCPVLLFVCGPVCDYMYVTWHFNKTTENKRASFWNLILARRRGQARVMSQADNSRVIILTFCNL